MFKNKKPILLKVISDGTPYNTHIVDQETGRELTNVIALSWESEINGGSVGTSILTLKIVGVPVELDGEWTTKEVTTKYHVWS